MIDQEVVARTLGVALSTGADFAEVFVEDKRSSSAHFDDGRVEELGSGRDRGAGIRVVAGETTGFAHTADLSERGLAAAAEAAAAAARAGGATVRTVVVDPVETRPQPVEIRPESVAKGDKVELLRRAEAAARSRGGAITQVSATYGDSRRRILVANSDGLWATDDQTRTLFVVGVVASGDSGMQTGRRAIGHTMGFELFDHHQVEDLAVEAADQALTKLRARPAPSGQLPVVDYHMSFPIRNADGIAHPSLRQGGQIAHRNEHALWPRLRAIGLHPIGLGGQLETDSRPVEVDQALLALSRCLSRFSQHLA